MAKSIGFRQRFPHFGLFLVIAVALAIPLTVWSLNNVRTNTKQEAAGCSTAPTWSNLLGSTGYPTSVKYHYRLSNYCSSTQAYSLSATRPSSGWSYTYSGCSANTVCTYSIGGYSSKDIYVTISRPINATSGTYYITLRAYNSLTSASKTISYVVIALTPTPTPKPLATPTPVPPTPAPSCSSTYTNGYCPSGQTCSYDSTLAMYRCK